MHLLGYFLQSMLNLQYDGLEQSVTKQYLNFWTKFHRRRRLEPRTGESEMQTLPLSHDVFIVKMLSLAGEHHADGHAGLPERVQRHGHQLQREVAELFILWRFLAVNSLREGHSKRETNTSY